MAASIEWLSDCTEGGVNRLSVPILTGVRVLDFTTAGAGLKATSQLGMLGAEILKLEPRQGNSTLRIRPTQGGISAFYSAVMFNKQSAFFDAKHCDPAQ